MNTPRDCASFDRGPSSNGGCIASGVVFVVFFCAVVGGVSVGQTTAADLYHVVLSDARFLWYEQFCADRVVWDSRYVLHSGLL